MFTFQRELLRLSVTEKWEMSFALASVPMLKLLLDDS